MSTKKTIYIIRHGETDFNKRGIIQGSGVDSNLNQIGIEQAEKFFKAYHHIPFHKIYSSELKRTIQSVQPFIDAGFKHEAFAALNEISWGMLEGLVSTPQSHKAYIHMLEDWKAGLLDRSVADGESPNALQKRQKCGMIELMKREDEQTILLCTHGRAMRSLLSLLTEEPLSNMDQFKHSNLCLYILEQEGEYFQIKERNSIAHLWI
ncbi:MAG: histidine phosphatase family protein [Bacteroidia bacterium]